MYPLYEWLLGIHNIVALCWTQWWVGGMFDKFMSHNYDKKNKKSIKLRWDPEKGPYRSFRHCILDKESMSCMQGSSKSIKWFLLTGQGSFYFVNRSSNKGALKKISPFAIQKGIDWFGQKAETCYKTGKWVIVG